MPKSPAILAFVLFCFCGAAESAPLVPGAFTSLGTLVPAGNVVIDTSATPPTMSGGATFTGVVQGNIAVFCFASVDIGSPVTITVTGSRTLAILSQGNFMLAGTINAFGAAAPGPGGGAGAQVNGNGAGPGGGVGNTDGAGGAGHGGIGGTSGLGFTSIGGVAYGDLTVQVLGGSGGARSAWTSNTHGNGGHGGGGVEIGAAATMTISATAVVDVHGGAGLTDAGATPGDGGGGGSGGSILVHGSTGTMAGTLNASGGNGGNAPLSGYYGGGGGSGGRIYTINVGTAGTRNVAGGTGGTQTTVATSDGASGVSTNATVGPQLNTSVPNIALGTVTEGTPGAAQIYTVSGTSTTASTVVTAPTGVEVSLNGTTWAGTVSITTTGSWGPTNVHARIAASATPPSVSGNITHVSTTANVNVSVSGTVNPGAHLTLTRNGPATSNSVDNDAQGGGGNGLVILDFSLATVTTAWTVTSIEFTESGTADGQMALNYLALFLDTNTNGQFDPGTDTLATATTDTAFSAANGTYTATLVNTAQASATTIRYFLVARLAGTALAGETIQAEVSVVNATSGGPGSVQGVPSSAANAALTINQAAITAVLNGPNAFTTVNSDSQGPGGNGLVLADVTLSTKNDAWTVTDMTFTASGTADEQGGINVLGLYEDDGNGTFDGPGVDTLATASAGISFSAPNGTYAATLSGSGFGMNTSRRFFLVAILSGVAVTGETFRAALTGLTQNSVTGGVTAGVPTAASSALMIDLPVLTFSADAANPAGATIMGGTAVTRALAGFELDSSNGNISVTGITLTTGGNANWGANITALKVYRDSNGSGTFEAADTQLFSGLAVTATVNCTFGVPIVVGPTANETLWVVLDLGATAGGSPAETYSCQVATNTDVAVSTAGATVLLGTVLPASNTLRVVTFAVTSFTPVQDRLAGGAAITINGSGFALPAVLTIDGNPCGGTAAVNAGGTEITGLTVPAGTGTGLAIVLTTNSLTPQTLTQTFTYRNPPPPKAETGSGCAAGVGSGLLVLLALAPLMFRRRR